jgi:hypothetical protein
MQTNTLCTLIVCLLLLPTGKYNDKIQYVRTTPCTDCPIGTTNDRTGADSKAECDSESLTWSQLLVTAHSRPCLLAEAGSYSPQAVGV